MLLYNVKKEEMRIGKHKGKTMYYASPIAQDKITTKQLEDRIVNATALSRADVRSAITALAKIVREEMLSGRTVDLANLGSFIGKSRHYGLGAVISFLEQGNGLCHPVLFPNFPSLLQSAHYLL